MPTASRLVVRLAVVLLLSFLLCAAPARAWSAKQVSAGGSHACAVTTTGGVRCWGANATGQLGDGSTAGRLTPVAVAGLSSGVTAVSAGGSHTCAVTTTGGVKCWGANSAGQLGDGTMTNRLTPVDVAGLASGVTAVSAGGFHTCALMATGGVQCWGGNGFGELGDGTTSTQRMPVGVFGLATGVTAISVGGVHSCALVGGGVKCWGLNDSGQLGNGSTVDMSTPRDVFGLTGAVAVSAGGERTCALVTGGAVKCWGDNTYGVLGDGSTNDQVTPVDIPGLSSGVGHIGVGGSYTCVVTASGGAKCWGDNGAGQLGDGTKTNRPTPVEVSGLGSDVAAIAVGGSCACAVTGSGGVRCWGANADGQIGDGTAMAWPAPVDVSGLSAGVSAVAAGSRIACALTSGGGVKCWGANSYGELGDGTTTMRTSPVDVSGLASGVAAMTAGFRHACALSSAGGVKCWGANSWGQLGDGTKTDRPTPVDVAGLTSGVAAVAAGSSHTCALTTLGGVKCWGDDFDGQLGDGTTTDRTTPVDVVGLSSGVAAVAAAGSHTCALTTGGGVKCWGQNYYGQVGDGSTTYRRLTPVDVSGLASGVAGVAANGYHTCVVTTVGGVACWGENPYGELGDGTTTDRRTPVAAESLATNVVALAAGGSFTCALTTAGGVKCWGRNYYGQLGDGTKTDRLTPTDVSGLAGATGIASGGSFACAVTSAGSVKCWGYGGSGELGNPVYAPRLTPVRPLGVGRADFDGDDRVDAAVYRPSSGTWFSLDSSADNATYRYRGWGVAAQNDRPVVGDFDGDGINDPTVYRPSSGTWFVLKSGGGYTTWDSFGWGIPTDTPVPGDYDGDGKTDAAVYRAWTGTWYVKPSSGAAQWSVALGNATDTLVAGDFDGDGKRDPAVYRASTGTWFWLKSSTNYTTYDYRQWGVQAQGDTPAPGDYDGDGKTDVCVFRPATGTWYILESHAGFTTWSYFGWGTSGDTLVPADYDGDGKTDAAVYRASTGTWYVKPSSGAAEWSKLFGASGDVPLVSIR